MSLSASRGISGAGMAPATGLVAAGAPVGLAGAGAAAPGVVGAVWPGVGGGDFPRAHVPETEARSNAAASSTARLKRRRPAEAAPEAETADESGATEGGAV